MALRARFDTTSLARARIAGREERIGHWLTEWRMMNRARWRAVRWEASEETREPRAGTEFLSM